MAAMVFVGFAAFNSIQELEKYCHQKNYAWNSNSCFKQIENGEYKQVNIEKINGKTIEVVK